MPLIMTLPIRFTHCLGAASQQEVFRSIQDNVGGEIEPGKFLAVVLTIVGVIVLLAFVSRRRSAVQAPRSLNHQGRLLREVLRSVPLKSRELKQLKLIAAQAELDQPLNSPLTLLLCPSVLARTVQQKRVKVDAKALASVARKAGMQVVRRRGG